MVLVKALRIHSAQTFSKSYKSSALDYITGMSIYIDCGMMRYPCFESGG